MFTVKVTPEVKVMTTFVDENGNVIIPNENGEVPAKDISEYELVRTEKDANGNVRHIYRKVVAPAPKAVETTPAKTRKSNSSRITKYWYWSRSSNLRCSSKCNPSRVRTSNSKKKQKRRRIRLNYE